MGKHWAALSGVAIVFAVAAAQSAVSNNGPLPDPSRYFKIRVLDEATGRGVPLVELRTENEVRYYTDSAGIVAYLEPGLMNRPVFFHIKSHGYEFPADAFGYRGKTLETVPGGEATLKIKRIHIAERLYRITGAGIYRDSLLTGEAAPTLAPLLNAQVMGQDSVLLEIYRGQLFWFWGDTKKASYALGQFATSGATSELPWRGGLDPSRGIDLHYFVDAEGFSTKMAPVHTEGMVWLDALSAVPDEQRNERLVARFSRMKSLGEKYEQGLVLYNDVTETFEKYNNFDLDHPAIPSGHPTRVKADGEEWLYYSSPFHFGVNLRVKAGFEQVADLDSYEVLTALVDDSTSERCQLARWQSVREVRAKEPALWSNLREKWKSVAQPIPVYEPDSGERVQCHGGSVYWNPFRQKWVMIFLQIWGKPSLLGEVWYCEADTLAGPWAYARKIVTHDAYTFYNVKHHPVFDQEGGRLIYFEGTYTNSFSETKFTTPRYDYNQIMYRLALDDSRLALPVPVYRVRDASGERLLLRDAVEARNLWNRVQDIPFFAYVNENSNTDLAAFAMVQEKNARRLAHSTEGDPLFYAIAPEDTTSATPQSLVIPLYEYIHRSTGEYRYETGNDFSHPDYERTPDPVCYVWKNHLAEVVLDPAPRPVRVRLSTSKSHGISHSELYEPLVGRRVEDPYQWSLRYSYGPKAEGPDPGETLEEYARKIGWHGLFRTKCDIDGDDLLELLLKPDEATRVSPVFAFKNTKDDAWVFAGTFEASFLLHPGKTGAPPLPYLLVYEACGGHYGYVKKYRLTSRGFMSVPPTLEVESGDGYEEGTMKLRTLFPKDSILQWDKVVDKSLEY